MAEAPTTAPQGAADDLEGPGAALDAPDHSGGSGSLLARLRAQRDAIGQDLETVLDVPGHHGMLAVKYRLLPFRRVNQMTDNLSQAKDPNVELNIAADLLAEACVEILVRDPDSDRLLPIDPDHGPTRFDAHALGLFGIDVPAQKPRDIVRLVFNRDFAVMSVQSDLVEWMGKSHAVADDEFAGK